MELEEKLKKYFAEMLVYKSPDNGKFFSTLSLPSYMRDWLVMKFATAEGRIDKGEVTNFVKRVIPNKEQWNHYKLDMIRHFQEARFLAKIKIDLDVTAKTAYFSLPDFGVPRYKGEAIADWDVIEMNKKHLLSPNDIWGLVELVCAEEDGEVVLKLINFQPFCPYEVDLDYFVSARTQFSIEEWVDVVLMAIDYNPAGYVSTEQKLTMISRLLPFAEKRVNLIELAPKGTGKSYLFSQLSKYGWLVSGGSISRAKMFYDIGKRTPGLAAHYDFIAFDEIQSIKFTDKSEMQGALKGYLESGEFRVGDYKGIGDSGLVLLGNIDIERMNINTNMFLHLPDIFHESALIDRFHGFIKGWDIPRMKESLKVNGWSINVEYFSEILHKMRGELIYRAIVDDLLVVPKNADTRDTEAIKRLCTGYMKLLFPHVKKADEVNLAEFKRFCLDPALEMRRVIKTQLGIIDDEFQGKDIPKINLKGEEND